MQHLAQPPTDDGFVQNPYRFYETARRCGDLFYWQDYDRICAASYRAVHAILRDRRWGRAIQPEFAKPAPDHIRPFTDIDQHSMLEADPPDHTRLRAQVTHAFTSARIARFGPETRHLADQLIDGFSGGEVDLLPAFCNLIPVAMITRLLGVPQDMGPQLLRWSHDMVAMYQANRDHNTELRAAQAAQDFADFIGAHITLVRKSPKDDLISTLISTGSDTSALSKEELTSTCILLLNAGHEATVHSMGNAIHTILHSGRTPADILAPSRLAATIEETLRFDPALHLFERHAIRDMQLFGHAFKRGDTIALLLASANRDEAAFENADTFKPDRIPKPHQSFGAGIHFCIGAPLARIELAAALETLFTRLPNLRLTAPPRYADKYHFHGLESLQVTTT